MSSIEMEQALIYKIAKTASNLIAAGKHKEARAKLKRIANSYCVSESIQLCSLLEAEMLSREGKQEKAEDKIKNNIGYLWGCSDALVILNRNNPTVDSNTKHYYIEILGGQASVGVFTVFSDEHIASFDVLANSEEEALSFIDQVCHFLTPQSRKIIKCEEMEFHSDDEVHRGVVETHPFYIASSD